ncbi:sugar porter (SP) family MFS transporter [Spizellomyces punctatus DAOM BR117]|uniref:Sugar porter (SP) family MFS transporter n=1 Tax=Spizellomyces punctatus (strain DAOM BR117) TaxID=645134 RepID=A0A0L0HI77_SPIPD|nr:sugar porter (SP) family MFS transporter [Spizellomyces punctatus DAOM BR117]KND00827.1 sugar porter (SP) family MFS transporter [Spizellomyces punctatus DAOM BR117]|eukprot:XP_016608866.1 sugar porter (SP) family MFS transporter [Spizellomyces punctatus DAOM BR117]
MVEQVKKANYTLVVALCLFASMGGFLFGYDTGTIGGLLNMQNFKEHFGSYSPASGYYFSNVRTGLIVAVVSIGCCIGCLVSGNMADRIGRRGSIIVWTVVYAIGIVIQISASWAWYQIMIGRIIAGGGIGALSTLVPMYQSETCPKQLRGILVSSFQLFITLGILIGYCVVKATEGQASTSAWRIPLGICFIWAGVLGIGMVFMPESPRYLLKQGDQSASTNSLAKIYATSPDDPLIQEEVKEIAEGIEREEAEGTASWGECFTGKPKMFRRLLIGLGVMILQQLTGANFFFYYGNSIFQSVGIDDSYITAIILGAVNFVSTIPALFLVQYFGRRILLIVGAVWMFIWFMVFASMGTFHDSSDANVGRVMIAAACMFILGFATTWAPLAWVIVAETYPIRVRSKAMGIATSGNWMMNFLISFFTPFITSAIGYRYGYVFAACCLFAAFFVFFLVPETKGRSLEEVDELYAAGVPAWRSANWDPQTGPHGKNNGLEFQHKEVVRGDSAATV